MFGDATHSTRVAMLPSAPELAGLIVLALVGAGGVAGLVKRWTRDPAEASDARLQIALPLVGLAVVGLPFLPILPDVIRPLRAFAGPVVWMIWIVTAALVVMTTLAVRAKLVRQPRSIRNRTWPALLIVFATVCLAGTAGYRLRDSLTYPSGDEPRYMIMMQSVWNDHALLSPAGASDRGVGLALLGAPILAWAGYHGLIWMLVFVAAVAAALTWNWAFDYTGSLEAATVAWLAIFASPPMLLTSFAVYPDILASVCVLVAVAWRTDPKQPPAAASTEYVCRAIAIACLPWLSMTYAPLSAALAIVVGLRAGTNRRGVAILLTVVTLSLGGWFVLTSPLGHSPTLGNPLVGALGLLFDQEFGVLPYAPALLVGLTGLFRMARSHDGLTRVRGRELATLFGVLLISVGALNTWWGGLAPPGRPLVPVLPLLGLPIAWAYQRASDSPASRAAYQLLVFVGVAFSVAMIFGEDGGLIAQDRDGSSRLLQWLTSLWASWETVPSIAAFGLRHSLPLILLWMAAGVTVASVLRRSQIQAAGVAALAAGTGVVGGAMIAAMLATIVAKPASAWVLQPDSRSRLPMLDSYDRSARPHAVVYNRLTFANASDIPPLMTLAASPGLRPGGQPVRVLLNARYALAAGEYEVEIGGLPGTATAHGYVALQLGRTGSPFAEWEATIPPNGVWRQRFSLPVDVEFVGFVGTADLEQATSLRIRPISIVDKSTREANVHGLMFNVLASVAFPTASIFIHDEDVYPESSGVWVHGESTTVMTVAPKNPREGITLRVHSGAAPNAATLSTTTWGERIELTPGTSREVHIPPPAKPGPFLLRVQTERSFVPAEIMPGSNDRRILGIWIEIQK